MSTKAQWLDRFATRLLELIPNVSIGDVQTRAGETFCDANDLTPEEAAEIYVRKLPPAEPGAPGNCALRGGRLRRRATPVVQAGSTDEISGGDWLMRFTARVRQLNPNTQSRGFMPAAWAIWHERGSRSPETAAEDFAAHFSIKTPARNRESS